MTQTCFQKAAFSGTLIYGFFTVKAENFNVILYRQK